MIEAIDSGKNQRNALVIYGSEYGSAQDVAEEFGRVLQRLHIETRVAEMNAVFLDDLSASSFVTIITSTTGQGDLPGNAQLLWKSLLRKRLPPNHLHEMHFTTFGLGDSSYPKYNWAVRKIHKRLLQLGAQEVYPRGEGDEQHPEGIDGSFLPWAVDLRRKILELLPLPPGLQAIPPEVFLPPKWQLEIHGSAIGCSNGTLPLEKKSSTSREYTNVSLTKNVRTTPPTHWQDVRHLSFESSEQLEYMPGDVLTIFPKNFDDDIERLIIQMGWSSVADDPICFTPTVPADADKIHYPSIPVPGVAPFDKTTLRGLLRDHLDITAIPRRSFFSMVAHFTEDNMHKERLLEFTNPELVDELYDYTTRPRRSILEVLEEFDSVKIPWKLVSSVIPPLRGRQFSIASGGPHKISEDGASTHFDLLVAIVKYKTVIKKIRQGVCTRYLANLSPGAQLEVKLQRGGLDIKRSDMRPMVLVGPGTGVAPIRSLLWERTAAEDKSQYQCLQNGNEVPGSCALFYGGRNRAADFFYEEEWELLKSQISLDVYTAFSRDQREKLYVQDRIRDQSNLVSRMLYDRKGILYICGSSGKMPQAVREALIEAFQSQAGLTREGAEAYLLSMEKEGRYKQETW